MPLFINNTNTTLSVKGEKVIPGSGVDVTMTGGQTIFISSEIGTANVGFDGVLPKCESSMGELSISVASPSVVIVGRKG